MFNKIFSSVGVWQNGVAIVRIITGVLLIFHGFQIFKASDMTGYGQWLTDLHFPFPELMAYLGKMTELFGGICLVLGIFMRIASAFLFITFTLIAFVMGEGKIFTDSQHPFLFALLSLIFFFHGAGNLSMGNYIFNRTKKYFNEKKP